MQKVVKIFPSTDKSWSTAVAVAPIYRMHGISTHASACHLHQCCCCHAMQAPHCIMLQGATKLRHQALRLPQVCPPCPNQAPHASGSLASRQWQQPDLFPPPQFRSSMSKEEHEQRMAKAAADKAALMAQREARLPKPPPSPSAALPRPTPLPRPPARSSPSQPCTPPALVELAKHRKQFRGELTASAMAEQAALCSNATAAVEQHGAQLPAIEFSFLGSSIWQSAGVLAGVAAQRCTKQHTQSLLQPPLLQHGRNLACRQQALMSGPACCMAWPRQKVWQRKNPPLACQSCWFMPSAA